MGNEIGRSTYRLVAHNVRGQVLGSVIIDDNEQSFTARCNDCPDVFYADAAMYACIDWIETHEHDRGSTLLPTSIERVDPVDPSDSTQHLAE